MSDEAGPNPEQTLAQSIAEAVAKAGGHAEVRINPNVSIPPIIAQNILEFMRRAQSQGIEAIAWAEAYNYVQQFVPQQKPQGVPFTGLPSK